MKLIWLVTIKSNYKLSNVEKDYIADLIDYENHNGIEYFSFILHDILEFNKYSKAVIEGNICSAENLVRILKDNTNFSVSSKRISY